MKTTTTIFTSERDAEKFWNAQTGNIVSNELEYRKDGTFAVVTVRR